MILLLPALLACAADPAAERAAFIALDCAAVRDVRLHDECLLFRVKDEPTRIDTDCPVVSDPALRDECRFLAIDAQQLVGAEAARACGSVGRFVAACHGNAISREVSSLPAMERGELTREIERIIAQFREPRHGEAAEIAGRRLAAGG